MPARGDASPSPIRPRPGPPVILTSGTTGTPKGARRPPSTPTDAIIAFLERVPLRARRHFVVAPMFHSWGFAHMGVGLMLGGTLVLRRRFDPEDDARDDRSPSRGPCRDGAGHGAADPGAARETCAEYDCSSLRIDRARWARQSPATWPSRFMDAFGDVVYNTYGSTEVAIVTIAEPADLRADPHTAGRPARPACGCSTMRREPPAGEPGRIFVGTAPRFEGYTGGDTKEIIDGLMSTGDVGLFDSAGRLSSRAATTT